MAMPRLDSLFHRPRPMRVVLQKFFVVIRFDDERLHFAQALDHHLRRVTQIGDESETTRTGVKGESQRIDRVVRYGKRLHRDIANGELGSGPKDSPVTMSLKQSVASNRLRGERVAINRHVEFSAE